MSKAKIENLILRSPLLKFPQKMGLIEQLQAKKPQELERMAEVLIRAEKDLFVKLKAAGLDMKEYQKRLAKFFREKTKVCALNNIENQI